jgi:hypothetical protein
MEEERREKLKMTEDEANTFVYTLEVINAALMFGWNIKIFRNDQNLAYLKEILEDNDIPPDTFFDIKEFSMVNNVQSAYEWAKAVQEKVFNEYYLEDNDRDNFLNNLKTLDIAYSEWRNPKEVFSEDELKIFSSQCNEYVQMAFSNLSSS